MKTTESFVSKNSLISTKLVIFKRKSDGFVKKKKVFLLNFIFFKRFEKFIVFVKQKFNEFIINLSFFLNKENFFSAFSSL